LVNITFYPHTSDLVELLTEKNIVTILNDYRRDAQIQYIGETVLEVNRFCNAIQD